MNVLDKAREAGMAVFLDACIGQKQFHSVTGSCDALERFAAACWTPTLDRATLQRWAELCERGHGHDVATAIRSLLEEQPGDTAGRLP
ncbi:hypothetical protein [Paraburkholderia sp. 32]|uniref:hypothetical protein n=1 Tax=unclassified Paraburkholderia TaxID=2615204 RepID=UPI003D24CDB0